MSLLDLAVLSALALVALYPLAKKAVARAGVLYGSASGQSDAVERWRQRWTMSLITLSREIEAGQGEVTNAQQALMLSKELMWEIIGGDSPAKGGK